MPTALLLQPYATSVKIPSMYAWARTRRGDGVRVMVRV